MNLCSKPGCAASGAAVLAYDYSARRAVLSDPGSGEVSPHLYVLCLRCAEKLRPPQGWVLEDERSNPPLFLDRVHQRAAANRAEPAVAEDDRKVRQLFFGQSA